MFETHYGENLARVSLKLLLGRCITVLELVIKESSPDPKSPDYVEQCIERGVLSTGHLQRIVDELKEVQACL